MSESTVVAGEEPRPTHAPPPSVVWLLRLTIVYGVIEVAVLVALLASEPRGWVLLLATTVGPLLRVLLGVATYRGRNGARIASVVVNVLGLLSGAVSLAGPVWREGVLLGVADVVEVVLIAALLVFALRGTTADWCYAAAARRRGEDPDAVPPHLPGGPGTSTVTLRQGEGPVANRPLIIVPEEQTPTTESGPGTRGCWMCGVRWHSHTASLADSGQLAERPEAEVEAVVTWSAVLGLTCRTCGAGACRDHLIRIGVGDGAGAESRCPSCSGRLLPG